MGSLMRTILEYVCLVSLGVKIGHVYLIEYSKNTHQITRGDDDDDRRLPRFLNSWRQRTTDDDARRATTVDDPRARRFVASTVRDRIAVVVSIVVSVARAPTN